MAISVPISAVNDAPNKVVEVICDCDVLWSLAQQFAYLRMCDATGQNEHKLIGLYEARARRIAATYARFYLETEDGGDPDKRGRYYWMALGAFASKTVACLLDTWQINAAYFTGVVSPMSAEAVANGLGKGNLWLFMDLAAPHWLYNHYPHNFARGMVCQNERSAQQLEGPVREIVNAMPWADQSLDKINQMGLSDELKEGFDLVPQIEAAGEDEEKQKLQMKHLMAVARHEQGAVLQPLIYDDPDFSRWTARERWPVIKHLSPTYQIVFGHQCDIDDPELKSVAPDDLVVEDYENRMRWIEKAAEVFHGLMVTREQYMIDELNTIAGWVDTPDGLWVY